MNEQIRISPIRLIGAEGEQHGIVPTSQALEMARESGMDLVEVAAQERPPVCKIIDYGKFKYAQSKKTHQKTHQQKLKEIRVRPKTGGHDIDTKIVQARKFLEHNDKVQVNVLFRGREMQHIEEGQRVMNQVLEALLDACKVESPARMEGKRMVALLAPKASGGTKSDKAPAKPKPPAAPRPPAAEKPPAPAGETTTAPPPPAAPRVAIPVTDAAPAPARVVVPVTAPPKPAAPPPGPAAEKPAPAKAPAAAKPPAKAPAAGAVREKDK